MVQRHGHGLIILHSNRMERLRELVVQWLAADPPPPLTDELFLVQSNGMAQWLKLALAEHHGISAANAFLLPARFLWQLYRTVLGDQAVPRESSFDKAPLTWRLLRLLPSLPGDARFAPLRHFLTGDTELTKHYQLALRIADLFDQYQVYRADWLQAWAAGDDAIVDGRGQRCELDPGQCWQPALWRALLADVPEPLRQTSRAVLHGRALERLRDHGPVPNLPQRLVVFGPSSLPAYALEALDALGRHAQVLLCVHNPCRCYWADVLPERELLRIERHRHPVKTGATTGGDELYRFDNPLLAAWGRQGRDYIGLLYQYDQHTELSAEVDLFEDIVPADRPATLLEQIQQAILDLDPIATQTEMPDSDRSLAFHRAHSRQREVEVLYDQLLAQLDADDGLQPSDIIVMVPDIEAYAAHFDAVFGSVATSDRRHIPYSIADRSTRGVDPLLRALDQLLALRQLRFSVSDVLDLLEVPALRERFGLAADDLAPLRQWIEGANIRWGLHAEQRASLDLPAFEQNSFRFGIERMLLGYASADTGPWNDIEPYGEVAGLAAERVGRLARCLEVLEYHWRQLATPAVPSLWAERLEQLLGDCLAPTDSRDEYLLGRFREELDRWVENCHAASLVSELPLTVVREAVLGVVEADSQSQRFLVGRLNLATLMPMRAIPFKVVCLLGMNDADYPRRRPAVDFDLLAQPGQYRPGDRSRRDDDHYLFLEALLSARDHLHISWVGRDIRDDSVRPPSVLVAELRDYIARRWMCPDGGNPLDAVTCGHPLQPFSRRYFGAEPRLFTYAREWREVHDGVAGDTAADNTKPLLPWLPEATLTLGTLRRFLRQPADYFMAERLRVRFDEIDYSAEDAEPFGIDALVSWQLKSELAAELSPGEGDPALQLDAAGDRLRRRGDLPPGAAAKHAFAALAGPVAKVSAHWHQLQALWPQAARPQELRYTAVIDGDETVIEDVLSGLYQNGDRLCRMHIDVGAVARKGALLRHPALLGPWIEQLAAAAAGFDLTTLVVAIDGLWRLQAPGREEAGIQLDNIVRAWRDGLQRPLPVPCKTAFAWLQANDEKRLKAARSHYDGGYRSGEVAESAVLARLWPVFNETLAQGIETWAPLLYQPLVAGLTEEVL